MKNQQNNIYQIGFGYAEGNQIEIDTLAKDEYRLICRDHFSQNFVDYYVHKSDLKGLADFIYKYLENN